MFVVMRKVDVIWFLTSRKPFSSICSYSSVAGRAEGIKPDAIEAAGIGADGIKPDVIEADIPGSEALKEAAVCFDLRPRAEDLTPSAIPPLKNLSNKL